MPKQQTSSSPFVEAIRGPAGVLPPGRRLLSSKLVEQAHRARLIAAMVESAGTKGYQDTTIADVVAGAQVSRRTFYELFPDKETCFLASYEAAAEVLLDIVTAAAGAPELSWPRRVEAGVAAYLNTLASEPAVTRLFLVDILAAGPGALAKRRHVHNRIASVILALVTEHHDELPPGQPVDLPMINALIGAVNELVMLSVEAGDTRDLPRVADTATRLLRAVLAPDDPQLGGSPERCGR
jgi:AcrR family transcriptional regulator